MILTKASRMAMLTISFDRKVREKVWMYWLERPYMSSWSVMSELNEMVMSICLMVVDEMR